jgi:hypothetical protein
MNLQQYYIDSGLTRPRGKNNLSVSLSTTLLFVYLANQPTLLVLKLFLTFSQILHVLTGCGLSGPNHTAVFGMFFQFLCTFSRFSIFGARLTVDSLFSFPSQRLLLLIFPFIFSACHCSRGVSIHLFVSPTFIICSFVHKKH